MFLWSIGTYIVLPFRHLQHDHSLMTTYIRQLFDILEIRNRPLDGKMKTEMQELPLSAPHCLLEFDQFLPSASPADLFISYKREDRESVKRLVAGLENEGHRTWFDSGIMAGEYFRNVILAHIQASTGVMPVWSSRSILSQFVHAEVDAAKGKLVPVKIEPVDPPLPFGELHTLDLVDWDGSYKSDKWIAFARGVDRWLTAARRGPAGPGERHISISETLRLEQKLRRPIAWINITALMTLALTKLAGWLTKLAGWLRSGR